MRVEVVYGVPERQELVALDLPAGSTVEQAIAASGLEKEFPDMEIGPVGIFSKKARMDQELRDGDRVEIYRPLLADPKEVRRRRAKKAKDQD